MKKVLALNGSMRKNGNTSILLEHFLNGAKNFTIAAEEITATDITAGGVFDVMSFAVARLMKMTGERSVKKYMKPM